MSRISAGRLRYFLSYDRLTGEFVWLRTPDRPGRARVGATAGTINKHGYRSIKIEGIRYLAHVLAWFYDTGSWPESDIDHKDTVKTHNWINNLRLATVSQNQFNSRLRLDNTSGHKGVSLAHGRWRAQIRLNGKNLRIGTYDSAPDAAAAYAAKAVELYGEFARLR